MSLFPLFSRKSKNKKIASLAKELARIQALPIDEAGYADVFDKPFRFHHAASFINTYREIFQEELYKFQPKVSEKGIILDCGANMGLSVMYFALNYPNHHILAFEPEKEIFKILEENVNTFGFSNVTLYQKAVWTEETELIFHSDGGMGGRVNNLYQNSDRLQEKVQTLPLNSLLNKKVDFLKIDIEGAEDPVLRSCKGSLSQVNYLFFEYHNDVNKAQTLHELLSLVVDEGFHYQIKESGARKRPFVDETLICERYDMALTVFCSK